MDFKTRKSNSYQFTISLDDSDDISMLNSLRKLVSLNNKKRCAGKNALRVRVALRKPKQKMLGNDYGYDYGGNVIGGIKNAQEADVYVYEVYGTKRY
jgi:pheromone shutdown protein TraB